MKSKIIYISLFISLGLILTACKKDKTVAVQPVETTAYTPGRIIKNAFTVDNDTVVKMTDVATNYGTTTSPVIFLVHQNTSILKKGYENVFFPLYKADLEAFMPLWAKEFKLNVNGSADEKATAFNHFLFYLVYNKIDPGLFVKAVMHRLKSLSAVVNMVEEASKARFHSTVNIPQANDLLFQMVDENKSPEMILKKYTATNQLKEGDGGTVISVFKSIKEIVDVLVEFAKNNKATINAPDNYISFISSSDTIVANYLGGTAFQSPTYTLSHDIGALEAKITYHVIGTYGATNKNVPGAYISACNTLSTSLSCKGAKFSLNAGVTYSPAVNAGSFAVPAAEMNGKVTVDYGDCCCCHYYSYLNFLINANSGYQEITFSKGN
jgi:hypothetical protein